MKVLRLALLDFRGYGALQIEPDPGVNVFVGPNGSGKTNLAEAVYALSLGRGWRSSDIGPLIRRGSREAIVSARVEASGTAHDIEMRFSRKGRRIEIDSHHIHRLSELASLVQVVSYAPEDAYFLKGPPSARRAFLDYSISKVDRAYFSLIKAYGRLLEERNALLKAEKVDELALDVLNERLAAASVPIDEKRAAFLGRLEKKASALLIRLRGAEAEVGIAYRPFLKPGESREEALKAFEKATDTDLERRSTTVGIQREDFSLLVNGLSVGEFGSQGENRLASLAIRLAPAFLAAEGEKPIVILDDAWSELDEERGENLKHLLKELGQCFVTATSFNYEGARRFDISRLAAKEDN